MYAPQVMVAEPRATATPSTYNNMSFQCLIANMRATWKDTHHWPSLLNENTLHPVLVQFTAAALLPAAPACIAAILIFNTSVTCISWFLRS